MTTWSEEEIEFLLDTVLPSEAKNIFERNLAKVIAQFPHHQVTSDHRRADGDPVRRVLWGIAVGARTYLGPVSNRGLRSGPLTYADLLFISWALPTDGKLPAESKSTPTIESVARVLRRTHQEIEQAIRPDHGIKGFGL